MISLQPALAIRMVAHEGDAADDRRCALVDLEHDVDAVLVQLDDLRLDRGAEATVFGIVVDDLPPVGLG